MPKKKYKLFTIHPMHVCKKRAGWKLETKAFGPGYYCSECGSIYVEKEDYWIRPGVLSNTASDTLVLKRAKEITKRGVNNTGGPFDFMSKE